MIEKIQNIRVNEVSRNVWQDNRNNVYIVNRDKTAFLKMEPQQFKVWQILNLRIVIGFIIAFLYDYYFNSLFIGIAIGAVCYVAIEAYYRLKFLNGLMEVGKIKDPNELSKGGFLDFKLEKKSLLKRTLMCLIVDVLLFINFFSLEYNLSALTDLSDMKTFLTVFLYCAFIIAVSIFFVLYLIAWIKKKD